MSLSVKRELEAEAEATAATHEESKTFQTV